MSWARSLVWPWDEGLRLRADRLRFSFLATARERENEVIVRRLGACNWK